MKLYDCQMAPNPRRARIFIREKGLDIPFQEVDLMAGENLAEAYRAVNPWGLIPTLELDDGTCIDEVPAICSYLEAQHPDPPLLGTTPLERAQVISWERHMEHGGMQSIGEMFRNSAPPFAERGLAGREADKAIPELVARGRRGIDLFFEKLETRLAKSPYIAGENYSLADITGLCAVDFAGFVKCGIPDGNVHTKAWYEKVSSRPATKV